MLSLKLLRGATTALAAGALLLLGSGPAEALELGQPAPPFVLPKLVGEGSLSTESLRDQRAQLLVFWAST